MNMNLIAVSALMAFPSASRFVETEMSLLALAARQDDLHSCNALRRILLLQKQHSLIRTFAERNLESSSTAIRVFLIESLAELPSRSPEMGDALRRFAENETTPQDVRIAAIRALGSRRHAEAKSHQCLVRLVSQKLEPVRTQALFGLIVVEAGSSENSEIRCAAAIAIWKLEGSVKRVGPVLSSLLRSEWPSDRLTSLAAIEQIGPALRDQLGGQILVIAESGESLESAKALAMVDVFAPDKPVAVATLRKALVRSTSAHRKFTTDYHTGRTTLTLKQFVLASRMLANDCATAQELLAAQREHAFPEIHNLLSSEDADLRSAGIGVLRHMNRLGFRNLPESITKAVEQRLSDKDLGVRESARALLGTLRK